MSIEDASALVELVKQIKDQKLSEGLASSEVKWSYFDHVAQKPLEFTYKVGDGWQFFGKELTTLVEAALKEIDTFKAIKPSVKW